MYHYLFTNDLRISTLNESLKRAGYCFMTDSVPSAQENKNDNNNMKTLGFYFNLTETSNCAVACANGDVRKVVLNFIKKFQFPNPRTAESLTDAMNDNILVAPMRVVLQVLYNMQMLYPGAAYLTREEIKDFVFYNSYVAKNKRFNVIELIEQIINYRKTSVYPDSVDKTPINRQWKQEDRQIREMTKILTWSGCVSEDENQRLFIHHDNLTLQNKAALFDILTYNNFWNPQATKNYAENREDYEAYMDVETKEENIDDSFDDIFNHSVYGMHIKLQNDALSEDNPHVCIGWSRMGDLSDITTKDELALKYDATWSDVNPRKKGQDVGQVWRFIKEMKTGDYVVFSCGDTCHIGRITSDYYFDDTANENQHPDYTNIRDVEWLKKDICKSDLSQALQNSLGAAMSVFGLNDYKSAIQELLNGTYVKDLADVDISASHVLGGYNKIFYGAPGCGKSFIINKMLDDANISKDNRIRVTFHPEYSNCDFVGQILPTVEKNVNETTGESEEVVKYIFNPGPFTLALERANNTNDMVYLVIEEINRGNAAAIFGDLFQLLDRVNDPSKHNFGESEYPICNVNIQKYLGMGDGDELIIPSNLTIFATMNTSDQNVFTLDTAFKRRWSFEQISNNIEKDTDHKYKGYFVPGTDVTWEKFLTVINKEILKHKITSEDKRMGKYFVSKDCLTDTVCDIVDVQVEAQKFAYKVLEYIWNDVCKISKDDWFDTSELLTLEDLIDAFVNPKADEGPLAVFKTISFK